jgi:Sec-independent protein translocase protein TatA
MFDKPRNGSRPPPEAANIDGVEFWTTATRAFRALPDRGYGGRMLANVGDLPYVIVIALIVLIGGSQLPKIARNIGLAGKEFRKAQTEAEDEHASKAAQSTTTGTAGGPTPPPPVALPATQATPQAAPPTPSGGAGQPDSGESNITLTPAQLDALLKAREEQVRNQSGPATDN